MSSDPDTPIDNTPKGEEEEEEYKEPDIFRRVKDGSVNWHEYIRFYANENKIGYREAMSDKEARELWHKLKPKKEKKKSVVGNVKCPKCGYNI